MSQTKTIYLAQYDAAADADKFPLVRRWLDTEPLPFFKELREQRPILVTPACTLVTRFDDVTEILNMPHIFTVELYRPKMGDYLMSHDDDALHTREKSIMQGMLNREDLPQVRAMIAKSAKAILDNAGGSIEVVNAYCRMVPAILVQDYFGLTGVDRKDLIEWSYWNQYDNFHNHPFDLMSDEKRQFIIDHHKAVSEHLTRYIAELIARRELAVKAEQAQHVLFALWYALCKLVRHALGKKNEVLNDDIVTRMVRTKFADAVDFDVKNVAVNAGGLLIGAIETTSQAVAQVIQYLLQHPEWLTKAIITAQRDDTEEFDAIVWEALRFVPIAPYLFRKAASEYTVGKNSPRETRIQSGTYVLTVTQSAMFDPLIFKNPDEFSPYRNWYHYFHFGFGSHECLGKYIGMVMIPEMVRQVLIKPGIKAAGNIDYKDGPFPEHYELSWNVNG